MKKWSKYRILLILTIGIGIIGLGNYCYVNTKVKNILAEGKIKEKPISDNSKKNDDVSMSPTQIEDCLAIINITPQSSENDFSKSLFDLEKVKQSIFDGNTITFLITLIITLLAGNFILIHKEISDQTKRIDHQVDKVDEFMNNFSMYANKIDVYNKKVDANIQEGFISNILQSIYLAAINIESVLINQDYKITPSINILIYHIDSRIDRLEMNIPSNIYADTKMQFVEIISNSMQSLHIEKVRRVKGNAKLIHPVEDTYDRLSGIKNRILFLDEFPNR